METISDHRPSWSHSLAIRMAVVWAVLLGSAVGISSWIAHRESSQRLLSNLRQEIERNSSEVQLRLQTWMRGIREDARSISQSPLVSEYLARRGTEEEARWRELLEDEFRAVFAGKPAYFQMRLLSAKDSNDGTEIVRLDRKDGHLEVTPPERLQSKAGRSYYQEALASPPDAVYLSAIDLNRDFGGITVPHIPTIRAAVKVGSPDTGRAMLIINADLRPLFDEIHSLVSPAVEIRLIDDKGDFLLHPDPNRRFASDLDPDGFARRKASASTPGGAPGETADKRAPATSPHEQSIINRVELGGSPARGLTSIVSLAEQAWLPDLQRSQRRGIWITALATLAGAGIAVLVSLPFTSRIRRLSSALREFDAHDRAEAMPLTDRHRDEIGIAIDRFREMSLKVRDQVERLRSAHDEAHEANATKEAFLATMSHEIRTPMNAIVGLIRALEENDPPAHQRPILESLRSSASNLVILLNTVLDYTRLRDGTLHYARESFDAAELVREVAQSLSPEALGKQLDLEVEVPDSLRVSGDPVRLRQVINNLLNNAVKFTEQGFVRVALGHRQGILECRVSDSGPGVRAEDRARIFTPFVSLKSGDSQLETGAGLGLAVSREIVEQQGGELILEDAGAGENGAGASFVVTLPYAAVATADAGEDPSLAAGPAPRIRQDLRVLYVEDVASNREVMALTLERSGIELAFATTGREALDRLGQQAFDLVMVDLQLPDMQGDELARRIIAGHPQLPIVAVTAQSSARSDRRLRESGIRAVSIKPYTREEILEIIATQTGPRLGAVIESIHPENPERARKLARTMAEELKRAAQTIGSLGLQPDDSREAATIDRLRHKLKTAIARFDLRDLDQMLERLAQAPHDSAQLAREARERLEAAARELVQFADAPDPPPADPFSRGASG